MPVEEPDHPEEEPEAPPPYRNRIAVLPGDPPIAYRPGVVLVDEDTHAALGGGGGPVFEGRGDVGPPPSGQWYRLEGIADPPAFVAEQTRQRRTAELDVVWFANAECCGCPPHPALATELAADPWWANPWRANPWRANPWRANPWRANAWSANPWRANPEQLNVVATGTPPTSSVMPAPDRVLPVRPVQAGNDVVIGVLDSGLAGGRTNADGYRPAFLGTDQVSLGRITGGSDVPSRAIGAYPADHYIDPVAGHGTFIAGIVEQLTPGCRIVVRRVFHPEGDVDVSTLAGSLWGLVTSVAPAIVNFSFGGTGRSLAFESVVEHCHRHHGIVFVAAAGNEGSCVEQYPAALASVIGVAALGPTGPAPWSNYGPWVDACAPGTDLVSSFFARFDGDIPPINGLDADDFEQWATWSGTSFAAPVVVAALAREMATTGCTAREAVARVVHAPHLGRLANMGTIVNL
jgi:hypothetical protein